MFKCERCQYEGNSDSVKTSPKSISDWHGKLICKKCYEELKEGILQGKKEDKSENLDSEDIIQPGLTKEILKANFNPTDKSDIIQIKQVSEKSLQDKKKIKLEKNGLSEEKANHPALLELNKKQRDAVLSEDKRILVLAGAGSGKTKTLIQKVLFLISEKNVDPRNILCITFTKNAANEMIDRLIIVSDKEKKYENIISDKKLTIKEKNNERRKYIKKYPWLSSISVKTFHGLCNQLLRRRGGEEFDTKYKLLMDKSYDTELDSRQKAKETPEEIVNKIILELCKDYEYLLELKRYILDYYVDERNLKMHKKGIVLYEKPYTTLKGDRVASKSERDIADWLYRHCIDYEYEPLVAPGSFEMQPDFFINEANLYLELVSNKSYPTEDKEREMEEAGENYLKIFEHSTHDSNKFNKMMDNIVFTRIDKDLKDISPLDFAEEFRGYEKYRRFFVLDILRMIDKIKVENRKYNSVYILAQKDPHARVRDFYKLGKPIFEGYESYCIDHSYLDFNDLLIRTESFLKNNQKARLAYQKRFKYVLVDEFQDVNTIQVKLLKHFLNEDNQLFCVGDDWQSIYGFRGSNVEYIVKFEKFFDNPIIIKLDLNYRSNDIIVNASNEVIKNNKFKIDKEIRAFNKSGKKIYLYCAELEIEDGVDTVIKNVKRLLKNGYVKEDILVLTRTRKSDAFERYYTELKKLYVRLTTIHQAKGLEAKIVFIIGLTGGFMGFPDVRDDDRIYQIIRSSNYELRMEEERRLFYVALTRAKEELFLISEVGNESDFISEIPGEFIDRENFLILNVRPKLRKLCINCNKRIEEDFFYCPYCGKSIKYDIKKEKEFENQRYDKDNLKNANKPWTDEEDKILKVDWLKGVSNRKIALKLGRSISSINSRVLKLRIFDLIDDKESVISSIENSLDNNTFNNESNLINKNIDDAKSIVLLCLNSIKKPAGRSLLKEVLYGSDSEKIFNSNHHKNPYFGSLKGYSHNRILSLIDNLISGSYIKFKNKDSYYPLIEITSKGMEYINSKDNESDYLNNSNQVAKFKSEDFENQDDLWKKIEDAEQSNSTKEIQGLIKKLHNKNQIDNNEDNTMKERLQGYYKYLRRRDKKHIKLRGKLGGGRK